MLYRACTRLTSLTARSHSYLLRASVHSSTPQLVKKNVDNSSKDTTTAPKTSTTAGSSYASGEVFYSHNEYSFYDAEIDMAKDRLKQISSKEEKKPLGK